MKKMLMCIIFIGIVLFVGLYINNTPKVDIKIISIDIEDYSMQSAVMRDYGLSEDEKLCNNTKKISLSCKIKNTSLTKNMYDLRLCFDSAKELPSFVLGNKIDTDEVSILNLKPKKESVYAYNFLIDGNNYSKDEIVDVIEDISLYVAGECVGLSCQTPYIKCREQQVSSSFKCKIN